MNIKQIIANEVRIVLKERDEKGGGIEAIDQLAQLPEDEVKIAIKKLLSLTSEAFPQWASQEAGSQEVTEGSGGGLNLSGKLAHLLTKVPGGIDLGAMYLASIDHKNVPASVRLAFLVALANLVSPVDLGSMLGADFLGPLTALDDFLVIKYVINKYKKAGLPSPKHYKEIEDLAASAALPAPEGGDDSRGLEKGAVIDAEFEEIDERKNTKISASRVYEIIKEELEVVLTNEEAEEIFDLDMSALLDEMMPPGFDKGDAYGDTKESCAAKGLPWDAAAGKCGPWKPGLEETEDKSFSKAGEEIKEKGTEGVFTAKADKAGMGVQAYAAKVLKKGSKASEKTKDQAAFAKGAATVARENK